MNVGSQTITYWAPTGAIDRYGKPTLAAPVQLTGRWEDGVKVVVNKRGEDVTSSACVYLDDTPIDHDGWMYLGASSASDPNTVNALQVIAVSRVPDIRSLEALTSVHLR